jgi:hypothetical protein
MARHIPQRESKSRVVRKAKQRPAEAAGIGLSVLSGLVNAIVARQWEAVAASAVGLVPAVWTFVVDQGGLQGLYAKLMTGRAPASLPRTVSGLGTGALCLLVAAVSVGSTVVVLG